MYDYRFTARREGAEAALVSGVEERFETSRAPQVDKEPGEPIEVAQSELPSAFAPPAPSPLLATPAVKIPVVGSGAPAATCARGYSRSKIGRCVKPAKRKKVKRRARQPRHGKRK